MNNNSYYSTHNQTQQKQTPNYLDLIKGGGGSGVSIRSPNKLKFNDHGSTKKNLKQKENIQKDSKYSLKDSYKQRISTSPNQNYESQHMNRLSQDSNSLHDLDIKYLTNTRQKVQSRKNLMELKNQMSPVYYNRDAERFSYLEQYQDPLIGDQFQYHNNMNQPYQYHQQEQMINYQHNMNNSKQYKKFENNYEQNNNKELNIQNLNEMRNNFNLSTKSNGHQNNSESSSILSKSSGFEQREDSFGNIEIVKRRVQPTQTDDQRKNFATPNLPPPPPSISSQMDPDLQKYTKDGINTPISTDPQGDNNRQGSIFRRQYNLFPRINMTIYIIHKNIIKFSNEENILTTYFSSFKLFNEQNKSNKKPDIKDKDYQNNYQQIYQNNEDKIDNNNNNQNINIGQQNDRLDQNMDSQIAKKIAKDLIDQLTRLILQKGKVYRSDFEDSLNNKFMTPLLREILPELNKLLLNSRQIRIQYDVINRQEYYELYPQQN